MHDFCNLEQNRDLMIMQAANILSVEQRRADFRPSDEVPASLDIPTEACSLVSALLAAVLQEASQTLQGSNLVSFNAEVGLLDSVYGYSKLLCLFSHRKLTPAVERP